MQNPQQEIHPSASAGYPHVADQYVRGRPDYPPAVAEWLVTELGLAANTSVLDLGAGTGKFSLLLVATGARVIAVEPVAAMLTKLTQALPQVQALAGRATAIPLPDGSVDVVVCAQAFHWFANPAALAEIQRVLKPGGRLGLIWNMRDASVDWVARVDRIVDRYEGDTPRYYTGAWRQAFPFAGFGALRERHFCHAHSGTAEDVIINRVRSISFIASLPQVERDRVVAELRALIASESMLRDQEHIAMPYATAAFCSVKLA